MVNAIILAILLINCVLADDDPIFRFVIEVVHHGARSTTLNKFDLVDKTKNDWDINHKNGELTNVGLREGYTLGRALREKYMRRAYIINEKYDDYQVLIKTAPYNAAILSGLSQMMGFYTPGVGDVLTNMEQGIGMPPVEDLSVVQKEASDLRDAGLPYYAQVLPIKTFEGNNDWLFSTIFQCNIIKYMWANISASAEYKALEEKYAPLYTQINEAATKQGVNLNITNMTMAYVLYDELICDQADDFSLINGLNFTTDVMENLLSLASDVWKFLILGDSQIRKAVVTPIFREWIELMKNVVNDDNANRKVDQTLNLALYVTDASIMLPIMNMLGKSFSIPFTFADNIIIQMGVKLSSVTKPVKDLRDYEMVMFYNGNTIVRGNQIWMDADEFVRLMQTNSLVHLASSDFVDWCNTPPYIPPVDPVNPEPKPGVAMKWNIIAIVVEVVFLLLIVMVCFFFNKNRVSAANVAEPQSEPHSEQESKDQENKETKEIKQPEEPPKVEDSKKEEKTKENTWLI